MDTIILNKILVNYRQGYITHDQAIKEIQELSTPRLMEECPACKGKGYILYGDEQDYCDQCSGTGKKPSVTEEGLEKILEKFNFGELMRRDLAHKIMKYMEGR